MAKHPSHTGQLHRINRAIGQLEAIKRMIEDNGYCVDIMSQLRAARNAIKTVELGVLETHVGACVTDACCSSDEKLKAKRIREVMELLKKYE
jgi:CsoR family transcriptional regulator, copper-sensing transcriptional repressor